MLFGERLLPYPNNKITSTKIASTRCIHKSFVGDSTTQLLGALGRSVTDNREAHLSKMCACYCTCYNCYHTVCFYCNL